VQPIVLSKTSFLALKGINQNKEALVDLMPVTQTTVKAINIIAVRTQVHVRANHHSPLPMQISSGVTNPD
tara:strand:+ start:57681 stop:57890 length:210 start_codon:yes stop_codon:yes gene_type:complete